jgi:hypothetical protein
MAEGSEMFTSAATVEVKPEYPGGLAKFYKFLTDNFSLSLLKTILLPKFI